MPISRDEFRRRLKMALNELNEIVENSNETLRRTEKQEESRLDIFVALDRTGSMYPIWDETVKSLNTYVEGVRDKGGKNDRLTLVAFDHHQGPEFLTLRDRVKLSQWKEFTSTEASPRGWTPLFDAVGRIVSMAEGVNTDKTIIVIITDGHENASKETTREGAKAALDRVKSKGWQTVFLGANFDAFDQAAQLGVGSGQTISVAPGTMVATMDSMATSSSAYRAKGTTMSYSAEDRKTARESTVTGKTKKGGQGKR